MAELMEEKLHLELPVHQEEYSEWINGLEQHASVRGVRTIASSLSQYLKMSQQAEKHRQRALKSIDIVNGQRTPGQKSGDNARSVQATARKFYEQQSTKGLRTYCSVFNIDYDSYNTQEEIIDNLVKCHLEAQN